MEPTTCPRRMNEFGPWEHKERLDHWRPDETCSFCGSLNPDVVMTRIEQGQAITPTDKNYKGYIGGSTKFYFQHFNEAQQKRFIELYNNGTMHLDYPGHFYVWPFFMRPLSSKEG